MSKFSSDIAEAVKQTLTTVNNATDNPLTWRVAKHVGTSYTGATANSHGDHDGTADPYTIFTVTGDVIIKAIWGVVNTSLTGASATIEVGVTGNTAGLIAQETATDLDDGGIYTSATNAVGVAAIAGSGALFAINDGLDIIETLATANVDAGQIDWYCIWAPAEPLASVVG